MSITKLIPCPTCGYPLDETEQKGLATLTEQAMAQDKWISVDVELPKDEQQVLSTDKLGRVYLSTYLRGKFKLLFHCDNHCLVTHWMPLPTPPKEAE